MTPEIEEVKAAQVTLNKIINEMHDTGRLDTDTYVKTFNSLKHMTETCEAYIQRNDVIDWNKLNEILRHARSKNESCSLELTNWIADNRPQPPKQENA